MSEQTATDRLRELLDERGIEWENSESYGANAVTRFKVNDVWLRYVDYEDYQWLEYHEDEPLTPEQAIAATVGAGTCEVEVIDTGNEAAYEHYEHIMHCKHCNHEYGYVQYDEDGNTWMDEPPKFCPNCGRRIDVSE